MKKKPLVKEELFIWVYLSGRGWTLLPVFRALELMYEEGYKAGKKGK